jgi:hypothetical protein
LNPFLSELPWARTGIPYGKSGMPDSFLKRHHRYSEILNFELINRLEESIFKNDFFSNNNLLVYMIFN